MDLSIIIPCHDLADWIDPMLESIWNQTNECKINREVIFVCDACTDNTHEIIEDVMSKSKWNYKIIDTNEKCPGGARNRGLDISQGKYIWFIDGDDWLTKDNAVDIFYNSIYNTEYDMVECEIMSRAHPEGRFGGGTVWRFIISREHIGDTRFDDTQNGEDSRFAHAVLNKPGLKLKQLEVPLYFYNFPREGSQMWKQIQRRKENVR